MSTTFADRSARLGGLRRFAVAITVFNVLGHTLFGFEQSVAQPLVALATGYALELLLEFIDARVNRRAPRFAGGLGMFVDFLLSAHITSLAVAMLLYANDRLLPIAFGVAVAIGSKALFRVQLAHGSRHFLNPSNFGITLTLLLFPWVGIAPPYHFTENLGPAGDTLLPCFIIVSGSLLNWRYTKRLTLLITWLVAFALQAVFRHLVFDATLLAALMPMTGVAFILFTFYMITDPATTPSSRRGQILFGATVALGYGVLMISHVVFGLFFALTAVTAGRGLWMHWTARATRATAAGEAVPSRATPARAPSGAVPAPVPAFTELRPSPETAPLRDAPAGVRA